MIALIVASPKMLQKRAQLNEEKAKLEAQTAEINAKRAMLIDKAIAEGIDLNDERQMLETRLLPFLADIHSDQQKIWDTHKNVQKNMGTLNTFRNMGHLNGDRPPRDLGQCKKKRISIYVIA